MKIQLALFAGSLLLAAMYGSVPCGAQRGSAGYIPQLNQGREALKEKKWYSAATHFREALSWDRTGVDAHVGLGNAYLGAGEVKRALEEFKSALRLNPHSATAEFGIHQARSASEEEAAFEALEAQVKREPDNADVQTTYAEELVERDRLDEARKAAETALRLNPKMGHAYCALGRIAAKQGRAEEARKNLAIAIQRDRTDDDAFGALGDLAMQAKDYKQAVAYYRREVQIVPDESEGHHKLAEALQAAGDTKAADRERALEKQAR